MDLRMHQKDWGRIVEDIKKIPTACRLQAASRVTQLESTSYCLVHFRLFSLSRMTQVGIAIGMSLENKNNGMLVMIRLRFVIVNMMVNCYNYQLSDHINLTLFPFLEES